MKTINTLVHSRSEITNTTVPVDIHMPDNFTPDTVWLHYFVEQLNMLLKPYKAEAYLVEPEPEIDF